MKRGMPWDDQDDEDDSSSDESASSDKETEAEASSAKGKSDESAGHSSKNKASAGMPDKRKRGAIDFQALKQHGYKGGLSVLKVPAPKDDGNPNWSWSTGRENGSTKEVEESYRERQKTRETLADAEELTYVQTRKEKNLSFSQKEKRKRDLGQASRGKNYVEEEKRMLRDSGIYSGFDA